MIRGTRIQKNTSVLNTIRKNLEANTHDLVVDMATDMAEQFAILAVRDTGAMAESVYVSMIDGVYQDGRKTSLAVIEGDMKAKRPEAKASPLPTPTNETTAYVAPLAGYFPYVEFGTTRMIARPAMSTARAIAQRNLKDKHRAAFEKVCTGK